MINYIVQVLMAWSLGHPRSISLKFNFVEDVCFFNVTFNGRPNFIGVLTYTRAAQLLRWLDTRKFECTERASGADYGRTLFTRTATPWQLKDFFTYRRLLKTSLERGDECVCCVKHFYSFLK